MKTPGQLDYESDVQRKPLYHDGTPRKAWDQLREIVRWTWERRHVPLALLVLSLAACTPLPIQEPDPATMLYVDCGGHPTHIPLSQYRNQPRCVQI